MLATILWDHPGYWFATIITGFVVWSIVALIRKRQGTPQSELLAVFTVSGSLLLAAFVSLLL
jgi:hypothetical protein